MNVLLLGSGGREHAFAWKIAKSSVVDNLYIALGNAGTKLLGHNLDVNPEDFQAVKKAVVDHKITMVIVGPEAPLVNGVVDFFERDELLSQVAIIGPNKEAAQLEGSKDFAKA